MQSNRLFALPMIGLLTFSLSALAQSESRGYLDRVKAESSQRLQAYSAELKRETEKGGGFDYCTAKKAKLKKSYEQWFQDHHNEIRGLETEIQRVKAIGSQKLAALSGKIFEVLPEKDQDRAGQVTLQKVIGYFQNFNERLKTYNPARRGELRKAQEDPDMNPMGVSHRQVKAATESMLTDLNSSLKQADHTFSVEFQDRGDLFTLDFVMSTTVGGTPVTLRFSLLDKAGTRLDDSEIWQSLLAQKPGIRIGNYSLDGTERYFEMYREMFTDSCQIESLQYNTAQDLAAESALNVSYETLIVRAGKTLSDRTASYTESSFSASQFDFYMERDGKNCNSHPGLYLVYFRDQRWGRGYCFKPQALAAAVAGKAVVFFVDSDYDLRYADQEEGSKGVSSAPKVLRLLKAGTHNGVAVVTYLTRDFRIETRDTRGNLIRLPAPRAPAARTSVSVNFYSDRDGVHCNDRNYRLMYVDGSRWGKGTCYRPSAQGILYFGQPVVFVLNSDHQIELFTTKSDSITISGVSDVESIVSISIVDSQPAVTYVDRSGMTKTVNLRGEEVAAGN